jgi:hypothetical protein
VTTATSAQTPGKREAQLFIAAVLTIALAGLAVFQIPVLRPYIAFFIYALPLGLLFALICAARMASLGGSDVPAAPFVIGMIFLIGGPAFDMSATIIHTPDLSREGNPLARALLDSGHSVAFVSYYGLAAQALYAATLCALWLGLLKHRSDLAASLCDQRSVLRFLKAATGGAELTWRQWIFPLRASELPSAYHAYWLLAATILTTIIDRWYLGFEWFGLVPRIRWIVDAISITAGLVFYFGWLWARSRVDEGLMESADAATV